MYKESIITFWANDYFGCPISDIESAEDIVRPHLYLKGYNGVFILKINNKYIVSAPLERVPSFNKIVNRGLDLFDIHVLQNCLHEDILRYIGPCWVGYWGEDRPLTTNNSVKILNKLDKAWISIFEDLQKYCDDTEWSHSGINGDSECIAVQYYDNRIVAAASYKLWGDKVAHIGVITHPNYRNKGFATNVIATLTETLYAKGFIPQYRTLCSNVSAIKAAEKCGYKEFAYHISIRLK